MYSYELQNVRKIYKLQTRRRQSFRDILFGFILPRRTSKQFCALGGVDLKIPRGQILGIIGKNGSGKTTLLKLLLGVSTPTDGILRASGKIAGLLELGAGFQEDLTGIENIYLNGLILGMKRADINKKIQSIVDFADIGDFVDFPVRTYSSGMLLRLGFAVMTGLDADIFLIDEVLSVGDGVFQKKCIEKIVNLKESGKTIVFVSHDLDAVEKICQRVILLNKGRIEADGLPTQVISKYLNIIKNDGLQSLSKDIEIADVYLENGLGRPCASFVSGEEMRVVINYSAKRRINNPVFGIGIYGKGAYLIGPNTRDDNYRIDFVESGGKVIYKIPSLPFVEGVYKLSVSCHDESESVFYDYWDRILDFTVSPGPKNLRYGLFDVSGEWLVESGFKNV